MLEQLKEKYKKTIIEPRLSGRMMPEYLLEELIEKIDAVKTFDEFETVVEENFGVKKDRVWKHIVGRISAWENEPPFLIKKELLGLKEQISTFRDFLQQSSDHQYQNGRSTKYFSVDDLIDLYDKNFKINTYEQ